MSSVILISEHLAYRDILDYLEGLESDNTRDAYARRIEKFFEWKYPHTDIKNLRIEQVNNISYSDMKRFTQYLRESYANSTVNTTLNAVYSLLGELKKVRRHGNRVYFVDPDEIRVNRLKETDKEEYGYVDWDEITEWIVYLKENVNNGHKKALAFELARITGFRKQALVNLTYKDLVKADNTWILTSVLKGKKHSIAIKDELAQELLELKETDDRNEKILKISSKTLERTLNHIKKVFNIPEERNVVFHSIRGESGYEVYKASGNDILAVKRHLGHESIVTAHNYISKREELKTQPSLYIGENITSEDLNLTNEQWKELFDKMSRSVKYDIKNMAKELGYLK